VASEDERCLPACTRRRSLSGKEVRTERRVVRFWIVRDEGTVMAIVLPETFLTKICIVSARSGDAERELEGEECIVSCMLWCIGVWCSVAWN